MMIRPALALCLVACLPVGAALAQKEPTPDTAAAADAPLFDGCTVAPSDYGTVVEAALVGQWNAQQGGGVALLDGVGAMAIPPQGVIETITFAGEPGALTASGRLFGPLPVRVVQGADVPDEFGLPQPDGSQAMMDMVTDTPPNCDTSLLPVVRISGPVQGPDGSMTHLEVFAHFLTEDSLSGVWMVGGATGGVGVHYRVFMSFWR